MLTIFKAISLFVIYRMSKKVWKWKTYCTYYTFSDYHHFKIQKYLV